MDQLRLLQIKDDFCKKTIQRVMRNQKVGKQLAYPYYIKRGLLHKYITDGKQRFEAQVIPANCANYLLKVAHDNMGHNGSARTYMLLRRITTGRDKATSVSICQTMPEMPTM